MVEIFVIYSQNPQLIALFLFFKMLIRSRDKRVQNYPTSAHTIKSTPIFQELISRVLLEIETRGQVFCIVLGPVIICIPIGTIGLLYLFHNTG